MTKFLNILLYIVGGIVAYKLLTARFVLTSGKVTNATPSILPVGNLTPITPIGPGSTPVAETPKPSTVQISLPTTQPISPTTSLPISLPYNLDVEMPTPILNPTIWGNTTGAFNEYLDSEIAY